MTSTTKYMFVEEGFI